jgi:hypothetical protein
VLVLVWQRCPWLRFLGTASQRWEGIFLVTVHRIIACLRDYDLREENCACTIPNGVMWRRNRSIRFKSRFSFYC